MNVGVILNNCGSNQPAFTAINVINAANIISGSEHKFSVFYKENSPFCCKLAGAATTLDKIFSFDGGLISTDLDLTLFMLRALRPRAKVLYPFELEWTKGYGNFISNSSIFNHPDLILISPSKHYAKAIENYCGRKSNAVIPQFNVHEIMKVVENEIRARESN